MAKSRDLAEKLTVNADKYFEAWVVLHQVRAAIFAARDRELSQYGVSAMKAAVLRVVNDIGDEATPAEISRWMLRKSHSVSGLLNRMEKDGLIVKTKDLDRRNLVRVTLTSKGKQALQDSMKRDSIRRIMAALPEEELEQFYGSLKKLRNKALRQARIGPKPPYP